MAAFLAVRGPSRFANLDILSRLRSAYGQGGRVAGMIWANASRLPVGVSKLAYFLLPRLCPFAGMEQFGRRRGH